jgi:CBS domain-containing protein
MSLARFEQGAVCAELDETVVAVAQRMRDQRVGCVIVVRDNRPIGIVTDRDLAVRVVAEGRDPRLTFVAEVVSYDATTVGRDANIDTALRTMKEAGVRRLPIVDTQGRVIGIVTADDLTALLAEQLADLGQAVSAGVDAAELR